MRGSLRRYHICHNSINYKNSYTQNIPAVLAGMIKLIIAVELSDLPSTDTNLTYIFVKV